MADAGEEGRPTRTRKAPKAADGTELHVPKRRKYGQPKPPKPKYDGPPRKRGRPRKRPLTPEVKVPEPQLEEDSEEEESDYSDDFSVSSPEITHLNFDADAAPTPAREPPAAPPAAAPPAPTSPAAELPAHTEPNVAGPSRVADYVPASADVEDDSLLIDENPHSPALPASEPEPVAQPISLPSVDSPLKRLPNFYRQVFVHNAKNRLLSLLTGSLPAALPDGGECLGLQDEWQKLRATIDGTLHGEGNSALLVGAPGTGKHLLVDSVLRSFEKQEQRFHVVHLDASIQSTDRLSLRELARQLVKIRAIKLPKQGEEGGLDLDLDTNPADRPRADDGDEDEGEAQEDFQAVAVGNGAEGENKDTEALTTAVLSSLANTTSTLLTLLSAGQTESKSSLPLVIVLSSFDLYTARPRQALLYVLLDAVQAGSYVPGLCVIGTTSRLDSPDLLEKRVRSRFSGRVINVRPRTSWHEALPHVLLRGLSELDLEEAELFNEAYRAEVEQLTSDKGIETALTGMEALDNDFRIFNRILFPIVASISPDEPSLHNALLHGLHVPRRTPRTILDELTTSEFALLVAAKQLHGKDCEVFNFAMCYDELCRFVQRVDRDRMGAGSAVVDLRRYGQPQGASPSPRKSITSSNVNVRWGGLLDRRRVMMAFRSLLSLDLFQPEIVVTSLTMITAGNPHGAMAAATKRAAQTAKTDFLRVKCTLFPQTIVEAAKSKARIDPLGIHLVQWATSQS